MPTVGLKRDELFRRLGREYTQKEFEQLCFDFGLELDEVTSEREELEKETGRVSKEASDDVIYKIDVPANRYDLLCMEGIARGLNIFLGKTKAPVYRLVEPAKRQVMKVTSSTAQVRPFGVAAVLRGVTFDKERYDSFIDLQDKLHQNICRRRTLVAIGTHDLDTIHGPFVYDAQKPTDIDFVPLRVPPGHEHKSYTADKMMKLFKEDQQLKQYLHIIEDKPVYPVIRDAHGVVLSMPPIINGNHSKITLDTKNIFIECTATDLTKAKIVLDILVCMFSEYCKEPFTVEPVDVVGPDGQTVAYPTLSTREELVTATDIYKRMGIRTEQATPSRLAELLTKMQLESNLQTDGEAIKAKIPPTRPDILHPCDVWEDAAVAFGFNNIVKTVPKVVTTGKQLPINKLSDQLREVIAQAGYTEALTFALCQIKDNFDNLRRPDDGKTAAIIANPKTQDFQAARVNLMSGLLKTACANSGMPLPIKLFEINDVVVQDSKAETGARNLRRLSALYCSKSPGFEEIQGLFEYIMKMLDVPRSTNDEPVDGKAPYYIRSSCDPAFFGQLGAADIIYKGRRVGVFGVVHPEVLGNYNLRMPCGALEMDLEAFL